MRVKVVGFQKFSFKDKKDSSKIIEGFNVYCEEKIQEERGKGLKTSDFTLGYSKAVELVPNGLETILNKEIDVFFNSYGRVDLIQPVK